MPRVVRNASKRVDAGLAHFDEPIETRHGGEMAAAMGAMQQAIVQKLAELGHRQMMEVMACVEKLGAQTELVARIATQSDAGNERWQFTVTERDEDGRISSITAQRE